MGNLKNKKRGISALQRRRMNTENLWKASKEKSTVTITGFRVNLRSPKSGEKVKLYAVYEDTGEVAPLRGSSVRGISQNPSNLARNTALNLSLVHHATSTPYETMAETSKIRQVTKTVKEVKAEAKKKIEELKNLYKDRENRRREVNTSLLREAIKRATLSHGLSLGSSTKVGILPVNTKRPCGSIPFGP